MTTTAAGSDPTSGPAGAHVAEHGRRPQLDGLRTLAVYLVVLFHCGIGRASGGFIGVDVFFVLSGYLVTGVLVRSHERDGRIGLGRYVEECRFVAVSESRWRADLLVEAAGSVPEGVVLDIGQLICPFLPICDPFVGGIAVFRDEVHITRSYSEHIAEPLEDFLREHGLIGP